MSREVQRLSEQLSQLEAARAQQLDDFEQQRFLKPLNRGGIEHP